MNTQQQMVLNIAQEYTNTPGPRTRAEGKFSAEQFLEDILLSKFDRAVAQNDVLLVDLDGGYGFGTSFLEEAFGGLARKRGIELVLRHINFKSDDEPYL